MREQITKNVTGELSVEMSASLFIGLVILLKMQISFAKILVLFDDMKILFLGLKF